MPSRADSPGGFAVVVGAKTNGSTVSVVLAGSKLAEAPNSISRVEILPSRPAASSPGVFQPYSPCR